VIIALEVLMFVELRSLVAVWNTNDVTAAVVLSTWFGIVAYLHSAAFRKGIRRLVRDIRKKVLVDILLILIGTLLFTWGFSWDSVFFIDLFIAFLFFEWDSRVLTIGALLSLAIGPFLLLGGAEASAEQMAVYAYYFLVMAVVLQIIEFQREPRTDKIDTPLRSAPGHSVRSPERDHPVELTPPPIVLEAMMPPRPIFTIESPTPPRESAHEPLRIPPLPGTVPKIRTVVAHPGVTAADESNKSTVHKRLKFDGIVESKKV
jgi:hypothetical protein